MIGKKIGYTPDGREEILVDNFNDFVTYNNNFDTDGEISITGNKVMEFRVKDPTYIKLPKVFLFTEEYIKNNTII